MSRSTRTFARHYVEMLIAMFVGMGVLGAPLALLTDIEAPALRLLNMALTMTIGMVAWMRYRGHSWMPAAEMSALMLLRREEYSGGPRHRGAALQVAL